MEDSPMFVLKENAGVSGVNYLRNPSEGVLNKRLA
jgi:hypothetical protein